MNREVVVQRRHRVWIALLLGAAAAVGVMAVSRTVQLAGASQADAARVPASVVARRAHRLDLAEVSLRRALLRRPPRLPAVPRFNDPAPAPVRAAPAPTMAAAPQRVVYVRPPPRVVHVHRAGGERDHERGDDGEGGGGD
jgi:hypothetical protein